MTPPPPPLQWLEGLLFSLVVGGFVVPPFLGVLREWVGVNSDRRTRVPGWLTGLVERLFFTLVVAFEMNGAVPAMIGWITLKMVSNWNSPQGGDAKDEATWRALRNNRFSALIAGLVGVAFAMVGGLICKRQHGLEAFTLRRILEATIVSGLVFVAWSARELWRRDRAVIAGIARRFLKNFSARSGARPVD